MAGLKHYISETAKKGAAMGAGGKMCNDCAFKKGSEANNDEDAVEAAVHCILHGAQFNCHTIPGVDAGRKCAGFEYAMKYLDSIEQW